VQLPINKGANGRRFIVSALLAFSSCQRRGEAAEGEQGEAKKKDVKPLASRSKCQTAQPALAEGPQKVRRPMLADE